MRRPRDLMALYWGGDADLPPGTAMFCGTLPMIGGIGFGDMFEMELIDPVLGRRLARSCAVKSLPVEG